MVETKKPATMAGFVHARNFRAYAIGYRDPQGHFNVRRVVWGRLQAQLERRFDESIRRAAILVEFMPPAPKKRASPAR